MAELKIKYLNTHRSKQADYIADMAEHLALSVHNYVKESEKCKFGHVADNPQISSATHIKRSIVQLRAELIRLRNLMDGEL